MMFRMHMTNFFDTKRYSDMSSRYMSSKLSVKRRAVNRILDRQDSVILRNFVIMILTASAMHVWMTESCVLNKLIINCLYLDF